MLHGIIDSVWVEQVVDDSADIEELAEKISERVDIELELEREYDWIAFVPRRNSRTCALTRYFGRNEDGFRTRGIEVRQHSTCGCVERCQELMLQNLDVESLGRYSECWIVASQTCTQG
ncbi:MAG: hypothetical protein SVS85_00155 [Candidatus Nanohaloarchaea archaeon]|nr:hypothetical protein [Candidatus Nanohaloarchaea archaeon]